MDNVNYVEQEISIEWIQERYALYKNMVFKIAFSYLGNKSDCEDILQEAFIKLCYSAPDFPTEEDEERWLIRVTINLCKNHLKSFWVRNKINIEDIMEYTKEEESLEIIKDVLNLPKKYKEVIQLYYFAGYKIIEISDFLKISTSAVKMRLKRGRDLLKIEMEDES